MGVGKVNERRLLSVTKPDSLVCQGILSGTSHHGWRLTWEAKLLNRKRLKSFLLYCLQMFYTTFLIFCPTSPPAGPFTHSLASYWLRDKLHPILKSLSQWHWPAQSTKPYHILHGNQTPHLLINGGLPKTVLCPLLLCFICMASWIASWVCISSSRQFAVRQCHMCVIKTP